MLFQKLLSTNVSATPAAANPVEIISSGGRSGAGTLVIPSVSGTNGLILMERDAGSTRPGFVSILYNTAGGRTFRLSYAIFNPGGTITTTGDAFYLVVSNFAGIGASGVVTSGGTNTSYPIPDLTGLNTNGSSLVMAFRYNTHPARDWIVSAPSPYTIYPDTNDWLAIVGQNTASSLTGLSLTTVDDGSQPVLGACEILGIPTGAPKFIARASAQTTTTLSTQIVNKPTGTIEGDLMVAVMSRVGATLWAGDTGWTEVADQGATPSLRVAYKVAGASEPSSYTFTMDSSSAAKSAAILTYRYGAYDTIGSFTTGTNPLVLPSISPSVNDSVLFAIGARESGSVTLGTPTGMVAMYTDNSSTGPSFIVCAQYVNSGATGTRSMSTGATTGVSGIMLAIKPA